MLIGCTKSLIINMEFSAKQIAELIQGRVEGDENATINDFAKIEEGRPGCISFLSNHKYTHYIYDTKSSVVLVDESLKLERPVSATLIRVKSAYEAVAKLLQLYASMLLFITIVRLVIIASFMPVVLSVLMVSALLLQQTAMIRFRR